MTTLTRISPACSVQRPGSFYKTHAKRAVDIALVVITSPIYLPFILLLMLLAARDGGSAFFGHERVGRNGRSFRCWKIRTMVPDSAERLKRHLAENPEAAEEWARDFKLASDPRVTPIGQMLRASSLDELPQLWNVLLGEMSLVGPRPVTRSEMARYRGYEEHYLSARPGLTGLWQVSGRNDVTYAERVRLDAVYAQSCSLATDFSILCRTVQAVTKRTGK